jgi:hypothetical protein
MLTEMVIDALIIIQMVEDREVEPHLPPEHDAPGR